MLAEVRTMKVADRSAAFFVPTRVWLDATKVMRRSRGALAPDLAARFFADVAEPPATTSLRVDVPTLVLWGMQDRVCLPGLLDNLRDYAPNATVVRIEDAGHYPMQSIRCW